MFGKAFSQLELLFLETPYLGEPLVGSLIFLMGGEEGGLEQQTLPRFRFFQHDGLLLFSRGFWLVLDISEIVIHFASYRSVHHIIHFLGFC